MKGPKQAGVVSRCAKYKCCVRTMSPTIRTHLSAASSEHNTHILRSGMPGLPASDLY